MHLATSISNPFDETLRTEVTSRMDASQRYTLLPIDLAERIALRVNERTGIAVATIALHGHKEMSPVRVSDSVSEVVIGAITLQALALTLDESTGELTDSEYLLFATQEARP